MKVTAPEGTYINYFQIAGGELGSGPLSGMELKILIWAGTQLIKILAPGWGSLLGILTSLVSELLKAFIETNNRNIRVTSIEATLDAAHFFTELIFVVQVNSDTPRESWPIMIDASADRMAGPNIVAETMRQIETITISTESVRCLQAYGSLNAAHAELSQSYAQLVQTQQKMLAELHAKTEAYDAPSEESQAMKAEFESLRARLDENRALKAEHEGLREKSAELAQDLLSIYQYVAYTMTAITITGITALAYTRIRHKKDIGRATM